MKIEKDWGWYEVLYEEEEKFLIKKLVINPKQSISYQVHFGRSETWYVVEGNGVFVLNEASIVGGPGSVFDVPPNHRHKVINLDNYKDLVCVEIWRAEGETPMLSEDDIERVEL